MALLHLSTVLVTFLQVLSIFAAEAEVSYPRLKIVLG